MEFTHNLAIEKVLFDHHNVDCLGILECEETKSSGSSCAAVSHNSAFNNFTELGEVVP